MQDKSCISQESPALIFDHLQECFKRHHIKYIYKWHKVLCEATIFYLRKIQWGCCTYHLQKRNKHPLQECQYAREVGISRWERHGRNSCALVKLWKVAPTVWTVDYALINLKWDHDKSHVTLDEGIVFLARFKIENNNEQQCEKFSLNCKNKSRVASNLSMAF